MITTKEDQAKLRKNAINARDKAVLSITERQREIERLRSLVKDFDRILKEIEGLR